MTRIENIFLRVLLGLTIQLCWCQHAIANTVDGFWDGKLSYRGDDLHISIEIARQDEGIRALLDIPSLVYANQPIAVSANDAAVSFEFPLGIGEITATWDGPTRLTSQGEGISLDLLREEAPAYLETTIRFGAFDGDLEGTLFLPTAEELQAVVVLISGSGNATRTSWSYASWAEFFLRQGFGAFVYDRRDDIERLPDGSIPTIDDHASDVAEAIKRLRSTPGVDPSRIGVAGHSRGAWIAISTANTDPAMKFVILMSPAACSPAEQEIDSVIARMRRDDIEGPAISMARAYLGLYFYVAQTGRGMELLDAAIQSANNAEWLKYVDQPRSTEDLDWWHANMDFDTIAHLQRISVPLLAMWGGDDTITPWADYRLRLEHALSSAGNAHVTTEVFEGADHRLEIPPGEGKDGEWHWFGLAPGALDLLRDFVGNN